MANEDVLQKEILVDALYNYKYSIYFLNENHEDHYQNFCICRAEYYSKNLNTKPFSV